MALRFFIFFLICTAFFGAPMSTSIAASAAGTQPRILVTIRYDAVDAMHGDAVERYHRPHGYASAANTEPVLDALAADYAIVRMGGWPMRSLAVHCEVYALAPGADPEVLAARLARDARVDSAEPLRSFQTLTTADVPFRPLQYALDELDVDNAHALSRGRGVRIAVIDSGIDAGHPDLNGAVRARRDFAPGAPAAHGTQVAGVIAARGDNAVGMVGVAPEAQLLDLRACWGDGHSADPASCDSFSLAQALDYAISNGVDVINLSLAGPDDPLLARLLGAAESRAISVVAAAPAANDPAHGFPTSVHSVIIGMSEDATGSLGAAAIRAPATDVLTTFPGGRYDYASGSSLAAAHVSGIVALARAMQRQLNPQQVRTILAAHQRLSAATVLEDVATLR